MPAKTKLNREEIELLLSQHTIGSGTETICAGCNARIDEDETVRFYATRPRTTPAWRLSRVYHDGCERITLDEGEQTSDFEADGTGTLASDPEIKDQRTPPDEIKETWEELFGMGVSVHQPGDAPQCYLEDVTLRAITVPGETPTFFDDGAE
jgi:hypothetical protein